MKKVLFVFVLASVAALSSFGQERSIAVTFDDLPMNGRAESLKTATEVTRILLKKLEAEKIVATGFVNERKLYFPGEIDRRSALLEEWLEKGHDLGNHTFSHIPINTSSFDAYKEDVIRGETVTPLLLEQRGRKLRYFRHTQLRTGPSDEYRSKLDRFLKSRSYTVAPVTIDSNEYLFAVRYSEAKVLGNKRAMDRIVSAYIRYMEAVAKHFEKLSKDFLGYEVRQILLLHANELNADHFDKLAGMLKKRDYEFVSLEKALMDKAYSLPEVTSRRGLSWIHRWMLASGKKMVEEPAEPAWIRTPVSVGK